MIDAVRRPCRNGERLSSQERADQAAEELTRQAEQKFRAIFDNTSDGIFLHDLESLRLTMGNKSCLQMLGYTEEEFTKLSVVDLHPEEDLPFIYAQIDKFLTGGKPIRHDIRFKRKDRSILFADLSPDLVEIDGTRYVLVALKDITERKRMEEQLRRHAEHLEELVEARTGELQESERRYRSLYHTIADGIFVAGADGQIADVNDSACVQLGYTREELMGMPLAAISARPGFDLGEVMDRLRAAGSLSYETAHRRKDGVIIPVELSVTLIEYRGRPAVLGVARDITERQRAQEALQEREYLLSESQRIGHIGSWSVDLATETVTWTRETFRLYGVSPDTFAPSADALLGLLHPDDRAAMGEWIRATLAGEHPGVLEFRTLLPDGSVRVLSGRGELVLDDDHRPVRVVGSVQDITEQKQAEESLRESQALYQDLVETSQDLIWQCDQEGRYTYLNPAWETTLGYSLEEMLGKSFWLFQSSAYAERDRGEFARLLQGGTTTGYETVFRGKEGREIHLVFNAKFVRDEREKIVGIRGAAYDITERRRAEEALRESEERFRTAFEEGAVAMALTALDSTLLKVNSSFCRMLGFSASELVGRSFAEITHPDDRAVNLVGTRRLACGETSFFHMEKRYIRKDGAVIWADMSTASVRDAQGRPLYCVTHIQDVTDRKRAEEALRRLNERLELQVAQRTEDLRHTVDRLRHLTLELSQAEDRERQRIADILHEDVQQTLAAAKFHLNLLTSEPRCAEESREIVEQVKNMLRDAIERSRSLSHELSPALYQVELLEILNWLARHMGQKHGLTVRVEPHGLVDSPSEPLKAFLYKVVQELLFNVVKHAGVSEARICVRRMRQSIYLSVIDQGRGFDPQKLEQAAGFGLLSIRERVQSLGGRMKIKSTPGAGSRFLIAVPYEAAARVAVPPEQGDAQAPSEVPAQGRYAEER
jgi:PAS domain S-box-containing protein